MRRQHSRELPARPLRGAGDENDFFTDVEYVRHDELRENGAFVDTDDFRDRKPDSFTNIRPSRQAENSRP
jgi:hypothetical protein